MVGGDITVEGRVEGDVATIGGNIVQKENAYIGGEVIAIDVRRPEEFAQEHIPGARSVPLTDVPQFVAATDLGATMVVPYCMKDFRGYAAIELLRTSGAGRIGAIDGFGLAAWKAAKLPLAGTTSGLDDAAALEALQKEIDGR